MPLSGGQHDGCRRELLRQGGGVEHGLRCYGPPVVQIGTPVALGVREPTRPRHANGAARTVAPVHVGKHRVDVGGPASVRPRTPAVRLRTPVRRETRQTGACPRGTLLAKS